MNMLAPHPDCALEYWYFKVNSGSVALLVDWIARRKQGTNLLRVSIHSPQQRAVLFDTLPAPMIAERNFITLQRTVGQLGDLSWAFDIECNAERVEPDIFPARLLRMSDLSQLSAPQARFTGWVRQGSVQVDFEAAPGMLAHYWGRQLAHEWWWISANQFDRGDLAVDCALISSALWGLPVRVPLAYLYLSRGTDRKLLMSPPAIARATGTPEAF